MSDYVRVKSKATKHEFSVPQASYDANPDAYTVLKRPATNSAGQPLPMKPYTTVSNEAGKKAAKKATTTEASQTAATENKES